MSLLQASTLLASLFVVRMLTGVVGADLSHQCECEGHNDWPQKGDGANKHDQNYPDLG